MPSLKCLIACAVLTAPCHAQVPDLQRRLLSEPLWVLNGSEREVKVWFETVAGRLRIACHPENACRMAARIDEGRLAMGGEHLAMAPGASAAMPMLAGQSIWLYPAWVVPTAWSRTGH
jgi:hypothetical protein